MEPIRTLYEREPVELSTLPAILAANYGGGFVLPEQEERERPYVIANFVETLDGIVSYNAPGQTGGGPISGGNVQDKLVMGLLRASADAVIIGSSSLRHDANHPRIPAYIAPAFAAEYETLRTQRGRKERLPISVVMTASGDIDFNDRTFHTPGLRVIIATTERGHTYLAQQVLPDMTEVRVVEASGKGAEGGEVSPAAVLALLARDYEVRVVLYEGGPTLLASFLSEGVVDELFLTLSPQIAGREVGLHRLALVEGHAFTPTDALWSQLLSVKLAGSHLLLRYRISR
jgi:riboflavin biosynthesis pyrimidine reductase